MAASVNGNVPLDYEEAILSADAEKWQAAMQIEFKNLVEKKHGFLWLYLLENH